MSKELVGFLPGSFDPPTNGHLDIIQRACSVVDTLYVGITQNTGKPHPLFTPGERRDLLVQVLKDIPRVHLVVFEGLAIDTAFAVGAQVLMRGIRSTTDAEYEFRMAAANRKVSGIDTLFLMTDERHSHISSTLIRQLGEGGKELTAFVPVQIEPLIRQRLRDS